MGSLSSSVDLTRWFFIDLGWTGGAAGVDPPPSTPAISLSAAPNPIRSPGLVRFWLARTEPVTLDVLDASGRRMARLADGEIRSPGLNEIPYDPGPLHNGLYFLRLRTTSREEIGKVAIVR
jgi:hypothetical protein